MREIYRNNHPVKLSYVESQLLDAGLAPIRLDQHASVMEGSIGAIQCRIMVDDREYEQASRVLEQIKVDL